MAERYDLVVVGAGPGGSSAAYHSAKAGLNTLLIDRQEFPRDKTCGDGLMPHAASEVALMGLADWLDEPHHGKFTGFSIYTHTATCARAFPLPCTALGATCKAQGDGRQAPRADLRRRQFRSRVRATDLLRSASGSEWPRSGQRRRISALRSPAGGRGRRRRGLRGQGHEGPPECRRPQAILQRVEGPDKQDLHVFITEDMNSHGAGYGWVFYFGDGRANVGAGVSTAALARGPKPQDFFDRFLEDPLLQAGWRTPHQKVRRRAGRSRWGCGVRNATTRG